MIRRVLVAVDGTEAARSALTWATDLIVREESEGTRVAASMINVWEPRRVIGINGSRLLADGDPEEVAEKMMRELTGDVVAEYPRASDIEHVVRSGFAGDEILAEARARQVDLIVVGTRAAGPIRQMLTGSVSQWVAADGERTVAVIPAGADLIGSATVVGFDGSRAAAGAVRWAVSNCPGEIHVVHVADGLTSPSEIDARGQQVRAQLDEVFHGALPEQLDTEVIAGDPIDVLGTIGLRAHQLVLGARSSLPGGDSIWGSVTTHLVAHAPRPIIVVPAVPPVAPTVGATPLASRNRFEQV